MLFLDSFDPFSSVMIIMYAVESYNEQPSMEQQQKMSLAPTDFIGNASSGNATSVQEKENEIQQQSRPIPDEFTHQESGKAVLVENNFSTSSTSVSRHGDQRSFTQYFYNCSVNVHNSVLLFPKSLNFEHLRTLQ